MPTSISFPPADCPAPASNGAPVSANDLPAGDAGASFDNLLNKAAPGASAGKASAQSSTAPTGKSGKSGATDKSSTDANDAAENASKRTALTAEELAALLALMSAAQTATPPLPTAPADLTVAQPGADELASDVVSDAAENSSASSSPAGKVSPSTPRETSASAFALPAEAKANAASPATDAAQPVNAKASDAANATAFALDASAQTPTARDQLAQGAAVLDYRLPENAAPVSPTDLAAAAQARTAVSPTDAKAPASALLAGSEAVSAEIQAAVANASTKTSGVSTTDNAGRSLARKNASQVAAEKFAVSDGSEVLNSVSGGKTLSDASKNNFLNVDDEDVASDSKKVGTNAANWGISMNPESRNASISDRPTDGDAFRLGAILPGTQSADQVSSKAGAPAATAPHAAQIVREIRDVADGLWAVERNSVEVRFHFSENERLSVKVEYRDGVVQTTFRTDSPELRDKIAREWQSQVAGASESRPYRVADPVFNTPPADARGFSLGGDSSRQQQRETAQSGNAQNTFATTFGRGSSSSSSAAAAPAAILSRPDTALHLHAFA